MLYLWTILSRLRLRPCLIYPDFMRSLARQDPALFRRCYGEELRALAAALAVPFPPALDARIAALESAR